MRRLSKHLYYCKVYVTRLPHYFCMKYGLPVGGFVIAGSWNCREGGGGGGQYAPHRAPEAPVHL